MNAFLDHINSIVKARTIEDHLALYAKAGFVSQEMTVRHPPGKRNGFVRIGPEYIEFEWVEDERAFEKGKENFHDEFRKVPGPFGFGFEAREIERFHASLVKKGYKVPDLYARGPADAEKGSAPWWTFQLFRRGFIPGVYPFALRYELRDRSKPSRSYIGRNGIFAICGVTFVSTRPRRDALRWKDVFDARSISDTRILFGPHTFTWMTRNAFQKVYGNDAWMPPKSKFVHLRKMALLHLYTEDLQTTERHLKKGKHKMKRLSIEGVECLYVHPNPNDGFAFLVSGYSLKVWSQERKELGQRLKIVRDK